MLFVAFVFIIIHKKEFNTGRQQIIIPDVSVKDVGMSGVQSIVGNPGYTACITRNEHLSEKMDNT